MDSVEFQLNRPKALNSLSTDMIYDMLKMIKPWVTGESTAPGVLMISGAGEKAFCAGGDVVGLYNSGMELPGSNS